MLLPEDLFAARTSLSNNVIPPFQHRSEAEEVESTLLTAA